MVSPAYASHISFLFQGRVSNRGANTVCLISLTGNERSRGVRTICSSAEMSSCALAGYELWGNRRTLKNDRAVWGKWWMKCKFWTAYAPKTYMYKNSMIETQRALISLMADKQSKLYDMSCYESYENVSDFESVTFILLFSSSCYRFSHKRVRGKLDHWHIWKCQIRACWCLETVHSPLPSLGYRCSLLVPDSR